MPRRSPRWPPRSAASWCRACRAPAGTWARTSASSSSPSRCTGCSTRPRDTLIWDTGHQAYVHKMLTGRHDGWDRLKLTGGLVRLPEPRRDRARLGREQPRLHVAVLGRRHRAGLRAHRAAPPRRRGDRRRRADRRHGLGGAQQHRGGARTATLVIVVNDNGRSYAPTIGGLADRLASLRLQPGYERVLEAGKHGAAAHPGRRRPAVRGAARAQGGGEGRAAPAGAVLRPRAQVPRPGRRARRRRAGVRAAPRPGLRRPGDRARRHAEGPRLPARGERRRRADARPAAFDPVTGLPTGPPTAAGRSVFADEMVEIGAERPDVVAITAAMLGPDRPGRRSPRRSRSGASTSASPSSTRSPPPPGWRRGAAPGGRGVLDVPQPRVRPVADGRRAAPARRHARAGPGGRHRRRRAVAQRHVGHVAAGHRAGHAGGRAARRRHAGGGARRGRRGRRRAHGAPVPEGRGDRVGARACGASTASTSCTRAIGPAATRSLLVCAGRVRRAGVAARARGWRSQGMAVTVVDPRWVLPVPAGVVGWRASTGWSSPSPTAAGPAASAPRWPTRCAPRSATAGARPRDPAAVPRRRQPGRPAGRRRADRAGRAPADHRVGARRCPVAPGADDRADATGASQR